jgi:group I intron endonuclease
MPSNALPQYEAYRITNKTNGKVYIGITTGGLKKRWAEHLLLSKTRRRNALHLAIAKYGAENFTIEAVGSADSWDALCAIEVELIRTSNSIAPHGYNMTSGGDGMLAPSDTVRAKMSARAIARTSTLEARKAFAALSAAIWADPEKRAAMIANMTATKATPEVYAAMSARMLAQWASSP